MAGAFYNNNWDSLVHLPLLTSIGVERPVHQNLITVINFAQIKVLTTGVLTVG